MTIDNPIKSTTLLFPQLQDAELVVFSVIPRARKTIRHFEIQKCMKNHSIQFYVSFENDNKSPFGCTVLFE